MTRPSLIGSIVVLSCLLWTSSAIPAPETARVPLAQTIAAPLPPSKDPFYTAPHGYQEATPGQVLRVRKASGQEKAMPNCSEAYNILYRTTDSNYKPAWAVTSLYVPLSGAMKDSGIPAGSSLLSYQIHYDSADVNDSPSYVLNNKSNIESGIPTSLGKGWFVNVPDYEGPLASFTAGVQSGHATIDSVRASLDRRFGLKPDARLAMWGYSGGALASEWAAELQVQYAPELEFGGAALGGLTPNVTSVMDSINKTPFAYLLVNGMVGLISQDVAAQQYVVSQLKTSGPFNASGFLAVQDQSTTVTAAHYADQDIFAYFKDGASILQTSVLKGLIDRDGIMGYHGVPSMPVFAYKAIKDEISKVADTDVLVAQYCGDGANILYQRNTAGGHGAEEFNGEPDALKFLAAVFDGSYAKQYRSVGCTIQNVTIAIDPSPE